METLLPVLKVEFCDTWFPSCVPWFPFLAFPFAVFPLCSLVSYIANMLVSFAKLGTSISL